MAGKGKIDWEGKAELSCGMREVKCRIEFERAIGGDVPVVWREGLTELDWDVSKWNLKFINRTFGDLKIRYRSHTDDGSIPWEHQCDHREMSMGEFCQKLDCASSNLHKQETWSYLDYQHFETLFEDKHKELVEEATDFPSILPKRLRAATEDRPVLWLGTKGASTALHYDSYGRNVVAQVWGTKCWHLYRPEFDINPSRIPYDDSSVWGQRNFVRSKWDPLKLSTGDLLYVPFHWWHEVEAASCSLSVNFWVTLPEDEEEKEQEQMARLLAQAVGGAHGKDGWYLTPDEKVYPTETLLTNLADACGYDIVADKDSDGETAVPGNSNSSDNASSSDFRPGLTLGQVHRAWYRAATQPRVVEDVTDYFQKHCAQFALSSNKRKGDSSCSSAPKRHHG
eukprot:gene67-551_t